MPFAKGQSGNPGGRKKKTPVEIEVEALAKRHGPDAIARLAVLIGSDDEKASIAACNAILDRGFGKPAQALLHQGAGGGPVQLEVVTGVPRSPKD